MTTKTEGPKMKTACTNRGGEQQLGQRRTRLMMTSLLQLCPAPPRERAPLALDTGD